MGDFLLVWMCGSDSLAEVATWHQSASGKALIRSPGWLCIRMGFPSVCNISLSKSGKLNSGSYCSLSSGILSSTDVIPRINGLKVFHREDALRDSCGVSESSVDQPPSILNCYRPFILFNDSNTDKLQEQQAAVHSSHAPNTQFLSKCKAHTYAWALCIWYAALWALEAFTLCNHSRLHFFQVESQISGYCLVISFCHFLQ